jgi:hypothetical protein
LTRNAWRPDHDRNQGSFDEPVYWMTRELADGWRVTVRLLTDQYRTVIDRIHLEAGHDTKMAAKNTGHAVAHTTRTTGRKIKHGTKRATHHMAAETEEGAAKVKAKTQ